MDNPNIGNSSNPKQQENIENIYLSNNEIYNPIYIVDLSNYTTQKTNDSSVKLITKNGQEIPSWMSFDSKSMILSIVNPPKGFKKFELDLNINSRSTEIVLNRN